MIYPSRQALSLLVFLGLNGVLLLSSVARADECKADTDCRQGFFCKFGSGSVEHNLMTGETTSIPPSTTGECEEATLLCQNEEDCPAYLTCQTPVHCTFPDCSGQTSCMPISCEPNGAPRECQQRDPACQLDKDCSPGFFCHKFTDIPPHCEPTPVVCTLDANCLPGWFCIYDGDLICGTPSEGIGSGGYGGEAGASGNAGASAGNGDDFTCTPVSTIMHCRPRGWEVENHNTTSGGKTDTAESSGLGPGNSTSGSGNATNQSSDSSCAVGRGHQEAVSWPLGLAFAGLVGLLGRRRGKK